MSSIAKHIQSISDISHFKSSGLEEGASGEAGRSIRQPYQGQLRGITLHCLLASTTSAYLLGHYGVLYCI
jgi:hypothetical protein